MADGITVKISGARELQEQLATLTDRINSRVSRRAVLSSALVIRDRARKNAPKKSGVLRRAIRTVYDKKGSTRFTKQYNVAVKHGKKMQKNNLDAYYWYFIEFGTKGHTVQIATRRLLSDGKVAFGTTVRIPAQGPNPFMRSAFQTDKERAFERMMQGFQKGIAREVSR